MLEESVKYVRRDGGAVGAGRFLWSTSLPEIGPRQVVPEYGSVSVSLVNAPVPDTLNVHPPLGIVAVPPSVNATEEPETLAVPVPSTNTDLHSIRSSPVADDPDCDDTIH